MSEMAPEAMDQQTYTTVYDVQVDGMQGLNSMLEVTSNYSAAADSLLGKIGKLNSGLGQMSKHYTGLKPQNAGAVSEAARYQQQLSALEATVKVSTKGNKEYDKTFGELRKNTKELAREMPIGMGQAIQQVDALQQSGVKSNKELKSLAQTYTELGKANSEYGPALGTDMQTLNRMYDANTKQARGYADSLTEVTQQLGGTASGTLQFAKSVAPIARAVGMGESQVLGMSNAFSRMGEDGYGAATAVNKVLMDMNRSIRQGTPEISTYARLLDMDTTALQELFESKPEEVLTRFTEAIQKKGPDAITELENLGLDGVRTARSVQAVAQGGGLRESIATAVEGYGSGATKIGAEQATSGLNDEMAKLQETTRQTVEAGGRPFLSFLEQVVSMSNAASGAIRGIVDTDFMQGVGKVGAVTGTVGGGFMQIAQMGLLAAFGKNMLTGGVNMFRSGRNDFRMGRQAMFSTGDRELARASAARYPMFAGAGASWAERTGAAGPAPGSGMPWRARIGQVASAGGAAFRATAMGAMGLSTAVMRSGAYDVTQARTGERPVTSARTLFRSQMEAAKALDTVKDRSIAQASAMSTLTRSTIQSGRSLPRQAAATGGQFGRTMLGGAAYGAGAVGAVGREAGRGIGSMFRRLPMGLGALGLNPTMLGVGALAYGGYKMYQQSEAEKAAAEEVQGASSDPHQAYNNFAAAVGRAGRSTTGFADAAEQAAARLSEINPNQGDQYKFSSEELRKAQAYSGPYGIELSKAEQGDVGLGKRIWGGLSTPFVDFSGESEFGKYGPPIGDWKNPFSKESQGQRPASTDELTARLAMTLGNHAPSEDVQRMLFDLPSQGVAYGDVQEIGKNLKGIYGRDGYGKPSYGMGFSAAYDAQSRQLSMEGPSEDATAMMSATFGRVGQEAESIGSVYGGRAAEVATYGEIDKLMADYSSRRGSMEEGAREQLDKLYASALSGALKVDPEDVKKALGSGSVEELFRNLAGEDVGSETELGMRAFDSLGLDGSIGMADILRVARKPGYMHRERAAARGLDADYEAITGDRARGRGWDKGLHGVEEQLFDMGKTLEQGGKALEKGMTPLQRALYELKTEVPDQARTYRAGSLLANEQMKRYGGNYQMANLGLATALGKVEDPAERDAIIAGQQYLQTTVAPVQQAQASPVDALKSRIQTGQVAARQLGKIDTPEAQQAAIEAMQDAAAAQAEMIQMRRQYQEQIIDTMRQIRISNEQAAISEARATEDYQRTRLYAEEDFDTQITRSRRDFHRQMAYAEDDYHRSRRRATEDFQRARARAEDDYQRSRSRAMQDFHRQREYAIQDHHRQVQYMLKDAASNMYDPYQRIQARDVMDASGLASNVQEQAAMLRRQSANIKRLKQLGLSQRAIDALDLYNPENAYQAERLVQDIEQDRNASKQLNQAVAAKDAAAVPLTRGNEEFRRQEKEFRIGMRRTAEQNRIAMNRMAQDQRTAMNRMAQDQRRATRRMAQDQAIARRRAVREHRISMSDAQHDQQRAMRRMATAHNVAMQRMREDVLRSNRLTMEQLAITGKRLTQSAKDISEESMRAIAHAPKNWRGPLVSSVNIMNAALRNAVAAGLPQSLTMHFQPVKLAAKMSKKIAKAASELAGIIPGFAEGGIVTKSTVGRIAEAGYPEAVVPLNHRGADMLAQVLQRYVTSDQVRMAHSQNYAAPPAQHQVYSYDYSTRIERVTVVANDPHEMFRKLEDIASTQRLVQPAGNQAS